MELDQILAVRCNSKKLEILKKWCKELKMDHVSFIREIIDAAPEGRVKIKPTKKQKELYT